MKKFIAIIISAVLFVTAFASCGSASESDNSMSSDKLKIVTTIFPQYDFARQIGGDKIELTQLLPLGSESHGYEPTVSDLSVIGQSDIFIYVGGESEPWVESTLKALKGTKTVAISLLDIIDPYEEITVPGMQENEEENEESSDKKEYDEHVWTSPKNAVKISEEICDAMCSADKANAQTYKSNLNDYISKLTALDNEFSNIVSTAKRRQIVVSDRFPFRYLCEEYGLTYSAAFAGCSSNTEPSLATVSFLISTVKENHIPYVFYIEFSDKSTAKSISKATGCKTLRLHSCHNVSEKDFADGATYLSLMEKNAENLKEALN